MERQRSDSARPEPITGLRDGSPVRQSGTTTPGATGGGGRKRIGVIGVGPGGLAVIKELTEKGHDVVAFEMQPTIGGVYAAIYEDLQLTTSSLNTSFGSYSDGREDRPTMWTRGEYLEYLHAYAGRFDLLRHIRFSTQVVSACRDDETGRWLLTVRATDDSRPDLRGGPGDSFEFDHVAVCTGVNQVPTMPSWPGAERFRGRIIHSSQFARAADFAGQRVLIAGLGESGSDIALLLSRVASASAVSTRNGPGYLIPRYFAGLPADLDTNRCYHAIPRWLCGTRLVRFKTRIEDLFLAPADDRKVLAKASEINRRRGLSPLNRFGTKNTSFVEAVLYHGTEVRPDISRLEEDRVVFVDGSEFPCDLVVCSTGYRVAFPFLETHAPELAAQAANPRYLFRHMISLEYGPSIVFIGFVRPGIGSIPPCAEMQARYFALLISGERQLPPAEEMRRDIDRHARLDLEQFPEDALRLSALTDYLRFMEEMATVIGCRPPLMRLFLTEPRVWAKVLFSPISGVQYRLIGPGAEPERAREVLRRMPTMPWPVLAYEFLLLVLSKFLYYCGMKKFESVGF